MINPSPDMRLGKCHENARERRLTGRASPGLEGPIDLLSEIDAADFPAYARSPHKMKY